MSNPTPHSSFPPNILTLYDGSTYTKNTISIESLWCFCRQRYLTLLWYENGWRFVLVLMFIYQLSPLWASNRSVEYFCLFFSSLNIRYRADFSFLLFTRVSRRPIEWIVPKNSFGLPCLRLLFGVKAFAAVLCLCTKWFVMFSTALRIEDAIVDKTRVKERIEIEMNFLQNVI